MPQEEVTLFWHLSHMKIFKAFLQKIKDLVMTENIINTQIDARMTCNRHQPLHTSSARDKFLVKTQDEESLSSDAVTGRFKQSYGRLVYKERLWAGKIQNTSLQKEEVLKTIPFPYNTIPIVPTRATEVKKTYFELFLKIHYWMYRPAGSYGNKIYCRPIGRHGSTYIKNIWIIYAC